MHNLPRATLKDEHNNIQINALYDIGSAHSFMSENTVDRYYYILIKENMNKTGSCINGFKNKNFGSIEMLLTITGTEIENKISTIEVENEMTIVLI